MTRLFAAVELPERIREALAVISHGLPGARWVAQENLHLTLRFVGEVGDEEAEALRVCLESVQVPTFELQLRGLGQFLRGSKAETLWAACLPSAALSRLQQDVEKAVVAAGGIPQKQPFHAHVTVGRLRQVRLERLQEYLSEFADFETESFPVEEFQLMSSHLRPDGPIYSIEESYPLLTGADAT